MTVPEKLSRPIAARIMALPDVPQHTQSPPVDQGVIEAAVKALDAGETHYTDRPGLVKLRTWVTEYVGKNYGVELQPGEVTITCGATEGRFVTLKQLTKPGSQVLCPGTPAPIAGAAHLAGVSILRQVDDPVKVSMVYLTPKDDQQVIDALLKLAIEHQWWVVWDISGDTSDSTFHPAQNPKLTTRVVTLGSLSDKMPGWRVGWMAGSEKSGALRAFKQSMTICTTNVSQWAVLGLVDAS